MGLRVSRGFRLRGSGFKLSELRALGFFRHVLPWPSSTPTALRTRLVKAFGPMPDHTDTCLSGIPVTQEEKAPVSVFGYWVPRYLGRSMRNLKPPKGKKGLPGVLDPKPLNP